MVATLTFFTLALAAVASAMPASPLVELASRQSCTDTYPFSDGYTCAQQAGWGKCNESYMSGYCLKSCNKCSGSTSSGGATATATCPTYSQSDRGCYKVSGLGNRKKQITAAGGTVWDLAIAMMESEMLKGADTYGDGKTGDAFNCGIFNQNWGMLRQCIPAWKGKSAGDYNTCATLNSNLSLDIQYVHTCQNYFGVTKWLAGHRNGSSGLANPNTADINNYANAAYWTRDQINSNSAFKSDDTRFWVNVVHI